MKRAKGTTFNRLAVLEQQADTERQERAKLQESQIDAAISRLGKEDYDFMAGFFDRCEHDRDLEHRTLNTATTISMLSGMPPAPEVDSWLAAVYVLAPDAVIPPAPDGAAVWLRAAADKLQSTLETAADSFENQYKARALRGYFRASANLADVLEGG